jgi:hypothetical protein
MELMLQRALFIGRINTCDGRDCDEDDSLPSIAGTGLISRLASFDEAKAREIVQTYLDSNSSIHAMPLSHR